MDFGEHAVILTYTAEYLLFYIYSVEINLTNELELVISKGKKKWHMHTHINYTLVLG